MKRFFGFAIILFFAINICACSQNENLREESTSISIPISDYTIYSGTWTSNQTIRESRKLHVNAIYFPIIEK